MSEKFYDIIPHSHGWMFVTDGYESAVHPSYELAVKAASDYSQRVASSRERVVLRCQNLKGDMLQVNIPPVRAIGEAKAARIG